MTQKQRDEPGLETNGEPPSRPNHRFQRTLRDTLRNHEATNSAWFNVIIAVLLAVAPLALPVEE